MRTAPDDPRGPRASWLEHDQQFVLAPARMRVTHARTPDRPGSPGPVGRCDVRASLAVPAGRASFADLETTTATRALRRRGHRDLEHAVLERRLRLIGNHA